MADYIGNCEICGKKITERKRPKLIVKRQWSDGRYTRCKQILKKFMCEECLGKIISFAERG